MPILAQKIPDQLDCNQIAPEVVLLLARGRVSRQAMESVFPTFKAILARMRRPGWIIDTYDLNDFEPGAVGIGTEYFNLFKASGGQKVIFVSGLATARMAATTISFAARVPLETCETLAEACERLGVTHPPALATQPRVEQDPHLSGTRPKYRQR